ncbi:ABC transporter ATP-binding protein [Corynebacterium kutscheri]|uniref:ABC transporter ATP-binding protein n=1 Tax=Corynebacterium kutscheri TaxID=35755 RepID=A0A0F6R2I3_9CORY|nr:ABC transporter ATP-binding protein [Corynebacterium kutscheri]AKE41678.1 ABC-type cobalamin/Fe3+-siderophore transport system, ATPase component [Corynebacterium kutscheri]VEH08954.1 ABC transporter ATP-binding protein [Corynebacterium kutscheri]VEH10005.1 ABC transporter ATP-binding protein [Corynebacterium kutscheri]VEH80086.1 ABC transporter ATP-binding protein [Corynebacterium kutscheri]
MIEINSLSFSRGDRLTVDNVDITAHSGRVLGLVGPNGAGKSTLLSLIYRLISPQTGNIIVDGENIHDLRRGDIANRMAVVAQHNEATLPLTVYDCVALGRIAKGSILRYSSDTNHDCVLNAIEQVDLSGYRDRLSTELSGGEWQRVLIARAIVQQASHLLLDEPTNHLDIHHQYAILEMMRGLSTTTVVVLHDLNLAAQFCDDIALLQNGHIVASGAPNEVLTAERVSSVYQVNAEIIEYNGRRHLIYNPM